LIGHDHAYQHAIAAQGVNNAIPGAFDLAALVPEAGAHHCACGAGAAAAALAFAREKGAAEGLVLEHTDSQAVRPDPAGTYVGYAGLVARAG